MFLSLNIFGGLRLVQTALKIPSPHLQMNQLVVPSSFLYRFFALKCNLINLPCGVLFYTHNRSQFSDQLSLAKMYSSSASKKSIRCPQLDWDQLVKVSLFSLQLLHNETLKAWGGLINPPPPPPPCCIIAAWIMSFTFVIQIITKIHQGI